ncbi:hypothetical protein HD806DRAFT_153943 [Xylariaceae sp. AK1471]|nr:hypothetical protein HD806DRAFT_153943 [Xylariaceae sp. AK1471]
MAGNESKAPLLQGFIFTIVGLSLLFVIARLYIKWKYRGRLWHDDYPLIGSVLLLLVNVGIIRKVIELGYGRHIEDVMAMGPNNLRGIVFYFQIVSAVIRLSTNLARISFAITLLQLSNERERRFVWFAITTLLAVMTPAIILPFVSCRPYAKIFDPSIPGVCIAKNVNLGYFIFEGAYTALVDFSLVFLPWLILSKLQIRRVEKLGASLAMSLGILSGVVTIVKVIYTHQIDQFDFTWTSIDLSIWNVAEPGSVIVAACIPNLRVLIMKNKANLKASFRLGSSTQLGARGKGAEADDNSVDKVQKTMNAISAGSDSRRGKVTAWITSRGDDSSERSILRETGALPSSGIVQTSTFAVEYPDEGHSTSSHQGR